EHNGSTNLEQRGGPGDKNQDAPLGGRNTFVRIYDERKIDSKGSEEKVGSRINPLAGPANGSMEIKGDADKTDSKITTYHDVLPSIRQQNMDELSRQEIPPQYQD